MVVPQSADLIVERSLAPARTEDSIAEVAIATQQSGLCERGAQSI